MLIEFNEANANPKLPRIVTYACAARVLAALLSIFLGTNITEPGYIVILDLG